MNYKTYLEPKTHTVEKAINRKDMVKNSAGGYAFKSKDLTVLRKWLLSGSMSDGFYQTSDQLTAQNISIIEGLVNSNPDKVAEEILYATNHGINNHTCVLALVYLSNGNFKAKSEFRRIFNDIQEGKLTGDGKIGAGKEVTPATWQKHTNLWAKNFMRIK